MVRRFGLILFLSLSLVFAAGKKPVTLEALSSQPAPSTPGAPIWAPDGMSFVYTEGGKLWLYDVPSRSKTELVSTSVFEAAATKGTPPERFEFQNRRVREQFVQWSPDGRELLIASGDLFLYRIAARGWTKLTATPEPERDAKLSPDGKLVSFRRGHDLYVLDLATRKETRLTTDGSDTILNGELDWVYPEELELGTAHWWSPDSKSIAYLQFDVSREPLYPHADLARPRALLEPQRYPRAGDPNADVRLGVVPAAGGRTRWMDLGETRDKLRARVYWLPDAQGIMVIQLNRVQTELEVVIADPKTGKSRVILRESDKDWVNLRGDPVFLKAGHEFLWQSERDGFNHLYRYSIEGKLLGRLTQGNWEVVQVAGVDEAAGQVYYVSSEAGPLEMQFYRVGLSGGTRTRLSKEAGTHVINMSPACQYYVDIFSNLTTPPRHTLHTKDGAEWAVLREPDRRQLEEHDILPSEIVEVKAADGTLLYARMIKPAGFDPAKKYPVIVNVYGGPGVQSVRNSWPGGVSLNQVFAHRGYVVWELDNRGTFGRGHKFEAAVSRNLGSLEVEDQKEGIRHLLSLGFADPKRIGIRGWSYGGYMTIRALLLAPDVFACGVAGAPVTDWHNYDTIYTERYMGLPSENPEGYRRSSNVLAAGKLKGRLLIAHNLEDDNVLFQNAVQMVDALQRAGKQFELMIYPNKSHGLVSGRSHFDELTLSFFERCLK
ncbi:MAG TPA: S9 family peptidase [Bryobacteraceae bacterium]|nr:S9 family peptidase [Bryobacteraceae bacterium]